MIPLVIGAALAGAGVGALAVTAFRDDSDADSSPRTISEEDVPLEIGQRITAQKGAGDSVVRKISARDVPADIRKRIKAKKKMRKA